MANTDDIRQELTKGRQEIAATHAAITEKLANLEDRVQKTVDGVKQSFDLRHQMKQRPWVVLGGAVVLGYMLTPRRGAAGAKIAMNPLKPSSRGQPQPSMVTEARSRFKDELASIKGAALGAVMSTLWAVAKQVIFPVAENNENIVPKSTQPVDRPEHKPSK